MSPGKQNTRPIFRAVWQTKTSLTSRCAQPTNHWRGVSLWRFSRCASPQEAWAARLPCQRAQPRSTGTPNPLRALGAAAGARTAGGTRRGMRRIPPSPHRRRGSTRGTPPLLGPPRPTPPPPDASRTRRPQPRTPRHHTPPSDSMLSFSAAASAAWARAGQGFWATAQRACPWRRESA